jgi:hypothetical protein
LNYRVENTNLILEYLAKYYGLVEGSQTFRLSESNVDLDEGNYDIEIDASIEFGNSDHFGLIEFDEDEDGEVIFDEDGRNNPLVVYLEYLNPDSEDAIGLEEGLTWILQELFDEIAEDLGSAYSQTVRVLGAIYPGEGGSYELVDVEEIIDELTSSNDTLYVKVRLTDRFGNAREVFIEISYDYLEPLISNPSSAPGEIGTKVVEIEIDTNNSGTLSYVVLTSGATAPNREVCANNSLS